VDEWVERVAKVIEAFMKMGWDTARTRETR
jgi:hypothetical protein